MMDYSHFVVAEKHSGNSSVMYFIICIHYIIRPTRHILYTVWKVHQYYPTGRVFACEWWHKWLTKIWHVLLLSDVIGTINQHIACLSLGVYTGRLVLMCFTINFPFVTFALPNRPRTLKLDRAHKLYIYTQQKRSVRFVVIIISRTRAHTHTRAPNVSMRYIYKRLFVT